MADLPQLEYGRRPRPTWRQWLRRLAWWGIWGIAGLAVSLVLAHTVWLITSTWRLNRTISEIAATGAPTSYADLQPAIVPAEENGYFDLRPLLLASPSMTPEGKAASALRVAHPMTWTDAQRATVRAYVNASAAAFDAMDRALHKPHISTTVSYQFSEESRNQSPWQAEFSALRHLFWLVQFAARLAHSDGNDAEFIRHIDRLAIFRQLGERGYGGFLGRTLQALGSSAPEALLLEAAPSLRIGNGSGRVSPDTVRGKIRQLIDPAADASGSGPAIQQMRAEAIEQFRLMDTGKVGYSFGLGYTTAVAAPSWLERYLVRPAYRNDCAGLIAQFEPVLAATAASDAPAARAALAPADLFSIQLGAREPREWPVRPVRDLLSGTFPLVRGDFLQRTDRRLAAAMLASRLYEIDNGRLPTAWTDLVPAYLPEIPTDPMAAGRPPLGIRREGDLLLFWSVGENGKDDGGVEDPNVTWDRQWYYQGDRVVRLAGGGKPPPARPSTAPSDN